tara:strand:+ start:776 stop:1123 length:348 start_codon:yes stop_codon:yes gene_type:complete
MQNQIETLLENIKNDYLCGMTSQRSRSYDDLEDHAKDMISEFNEGLEVREGSKYIKIMSKHSVWGFVVKGDNDKKFQQGDILKAAGWATPARNHARGNILEGGYTVRWTGPLYIQ